MPLSIRMGRAALSSLRRATNLPTITSFTVCGVSRINTNKGSGVSQPIFCSALTVGTTFDVLLYWDQPTVAGSMAIASVNAAGAFTAFASRPATGVWFEWYIRCSGTGANLLAAGWRNLGGSWVTATTTLDTGATMGTMILGSDGSGATFSDISYATYREFKSVLTTADTEQELIFSTPYGVAVCNNGLSVPTNAERALYYDRSFAVTTRWGDSSGLGNEWTETLGVFDYDLGPVMQYAPQKWLRPMRRFVSVAGTTFTASLSGSVTALGALAKAITAPKAGSVTSSGSAAKAAAVAKAGSTTSSGAATKRANKAFAGSSTSSGVLSLVRAVLMALAGSVTSTGTLTKSALKSVVGSCTSAGAIAKQAAKGLAGSITSSGALAKLAKLAKAGSVTASGVLSTTKVAILALAGSVTSSGTLAKSTLKSVVGACTSAGTIAKANAKGLVGSVTPSGALRKLISKAYAGAVTATGLLTRVFVSGSDLIIGLIGTFIVPAVRLLFSRVDPDVTLQNVSPSITASDVSPDVPLTAVAPVLPVENITAPITTHEPSVDD